MIRLLLVVLLLGLSGPARAVEPEPAAEGLAFALSMAKGGAGDEEAVAALAVYAADRDGHGSARAALARILVNTPARAGWLAHYDLSTSDPELAAGLRLRRAEARALSSKTRPQAAQQLRSLLDRDPDTLEVRLALARVWMSLDQAGRTVALLSDHSQDPQARLILVYAHLARDDLVSANELAGHGLRGAPRSLHMALDEGSLALRVRALAAGGWPEISQALVSREDPYVRDIDAWDALARSWLALNEPDQAAASWRIAVHRAPDKALTRERLVRALIESGNLAAAHRAVGRDDTEALRLLQAAELVEGAISGDRTPEERRDQIQRAWGLAPDLHVVQRAHGLMLSWQGEHEEALEILGGVLDRNPTDAEALEAHLRSSLRVRRPGQAIVRHREAAAAAPGPRTHDRLVYRLAAAHRRVGDQFKETGDLASALREYRIARATSPGDVENWRALAGGYWAAEQLDLAARTYRQALQLAPGQHGLIEDAIRVEVQRKDVAAARELLDSQELTPQTRERLEELILRMDVAVQAQELVDAGDLQAAITLLREGIERFPDDAHLAHTLGDAYMTADSPELALPWYGHARTLRPDNAWSVLSEANCLALVYARLPAEHLLWELELGTRERGTDLPDSQAAYALRVRILALRKDADRLRVEGKVDEAFRLYSLALDIEAEPYTLVGLGALYLDRAQPGLALAFFEEALVVPVPGEPESPQELGDIAHIGAAEALDALGRTDEALARLEAVTPAHADLAPLRQRFSVQLVLQAADEARLQRRIDEADGMATRALEHWPDDHNAQALLASIRLDQRRFDEAWRLALGVLRQQPAHPRALSVAAELLLEEDWRPPGTVDGGVEEDTGVELFRTASREGQETWIRHGLANARFAALAREAQRLADHGERERAQRLMRGAVSWLDEDPGRMSLVGRGLLAVDLPEEAEEQFDRALEIDAEHSGATIGRAGSIKAQGRSVAAERYLVERAHETDDATIWRALARHQAALGFHRRAEESLRVAMQAPPPATTFTTWTRGEALPALPLPSERELADLPPNRPAEVIVVQSPAELAAFQAELGNPHQPGFSAELGLWSRPGSAGTTELFGLIGHLAMLDLRLPGTLLDVEAVPAIIDDDVHQALGVGFAARLRTAPDLPRGLSLALGTSPVGFGRPDLHGRLAGRMSLRPGGEVGLELVRLSITDSVTSWAGVPDRGGTDFGRVAFSYLGGWLIRDSEHHPMDVGLAAHGGLLTGLQLDQALRFEALGWWGWTVDDERWWLRGGLDGYWLSDRPSIDGWAPPDGGAFSPEAYASLLVRVDGELLLEEVPLALCGGISAGAQVVEEEDDRGTWFDSGVSGIAEARAGVQAFLGESWRLLAEARWTRVGSGWRERTLMAHAEWVPTWRRATLPRDALLNHGRVPHSLLACRRPSAYNYAPQDFLDARRPEGE